MRRRGGSRARPPIPDWVCDMQPGWLEWLDTYGWHIFEHNDASIDLRERRRRERAEGVADTDALAQTDVVELSERREQER